MRKVISTLAIASMLGTTVLTPLNVLSTKGYAVQKEVTVSPYFELSNPNLMTTSIERVSTATSAKLKNWTTGTQTSNLAADTYVFTESSGSVSSTVAPTKRLSSTGEGNLSVYSASGNFMIAQKIPTEIGKEYTVSTNFSQATATATSHFWLGIITPANVAEDIKISTGSGVASHTFVATETTSRIMIQLVSPLNVVKTLNLTDFTTGKSDNQLAKEAVATLISTDGKIKPNVTDAWVADVQKQINLVENATQKAALQAQLDEAKSELAARDAAIAAETARQEDAEAELKALFNNNDVSGTIKTETDAKAIAGAQQRIDAVTDATKKVALQAQLDEAKNQLAARETAVAEETARQEAATAEVKALFNNNDVTGTIKTVTDAKAIADAQALINGVADTAKKATLQAQLDEAKSQLAARDAAIAAETARQETAETEIKALFNNNDITGTIKTTTDAGAITGAQQRIDVVTDAAKKAELQAQLDEAKRQLEDRDGEAAVERARQEAAATEIKVLFNNNDVTGTIKTVTNAQAIADAQQRVDAVTDKAKKAELQGQLDEAKAQLAAREAEKARQDAAATEVKSLFNNNDVTGTIKATTDNQTIASVQQRVDAVTDTAKKAELQANITEAKRQLAAREAAATETAAEQARQEAAATDIKALFNNNDVTGTIKATTDEKAIEDAQKRIDAVTDTAKKAELQAQLDTAKQQLADQKAAEQAENARQALAETAVKDLFNSGNVNGTIKLLTDAAAITAAEALVNAITNPAKKAELQANIVEAKRQLAANELAASEEVARQEAAAASVKELFNNNDVTGTIKTTTNEKAIADAQKLVDAITNPTEKAAVQAQLDEAKRQLAEQQAAIVAAEKARQDAATKAIDDLFRSSAHLALKDPTIQTDLDKAKELLDLVTDPAVKRALETELAKATDLLADRAAAEKAVNDLFTTTDHTAIKTTTTTQTTINRAEAAVSKLPNGDLRDALLAEIDKAQAFLDEAAASAAEASATVTINSGNRTILTTESVQLDAITASKLGTTWTSSNPEIASIDATGKIVGLSAGKTVITATLANGKNSSIEIRVYTSVAEATAAVNKLFTNDAHTATATDITQQKINNAKKLVNGIEDVVTKQALLKEIEKAEQMVADQLVAAEKARQDAASDAVKNLVDATNNIKPATDAAAIADAQKLVDAVTDTAKKAELQAQLDDVAKQLAEREAAEKATQAVQALFDADTVINSTTDEAAIEAAQALVNEVKDAAKKAELQTQLDEAAKQLIARQASEVATQTVEDLFGSDNVIKPTTDEAAIAAAQEVINALTDETKKAELQTQLDEAAKQLTERQEAEKAEAERLVAEKATQAVQALFDANDVINSTTDEASIAAAQALVNEVKDEAKKAELQTQLDEATKQLVARQASDAAAQTVEDLFGSDNAIKPTTDEAAIAAAQKVINALTDEAKKAELQTQLDEAAKQLAERQAAEKAEAERLAADKAVNALFQGNNPANDIATTLTQDTIKQAKELVAAVTDPATKAALEASIAKAQTQLDAIIPIVGQATKYTLGDFYISGTYTGAATGMSVDVNGKRYYGGTVENGVLKFYGLDKIAQVGDVVTVNLYDSNKQIKTSFPVQVVEPLKVTLADYKLGENYIQATYNNSDVTRIGVVVDGKKYWGGDVANGNIKFYALDKIKSADSVVTMNYYDASNNLLASKALKIQAAYEGEVTTADLKLTDTNIKGTFTGDIKQVAISVNGKMYYGGTIAANGMYKFYTLDKKITATDEVIVYGYSPDNKKIAEKVVTISE
ncbi:toxin Cry1Ac domain D-VI-related protein [Listeria weihenstephanensis]|nr:toxin Cry1Ac domain D-VI-related protein [Listeria weihenstephanensis]